MKTTTAVRWTVCLCALLLLSACFDKAARPVPPPSVIEVPRPVYQPIPHQLTDAIAEPVPPRASCVFGPLAEVCVSDALAWIEAWRGKLQQANQDRATTARLSGAPASASSVPP